MASYTYNVFYVEHCDECTGCLELLLSTTRKYEATRHLENILTEGKSLNDYKVLRSRDGIPGTVSDVDVYEFMKIDQGEVL